MTVPWTLYRAWATCHKWVLFRGILCRISAPCNKHGDFWVVHNGNWRLAGCKFAGLVNMNEPCYPVKPNTNQFLHHRRG